MSFFKRNDPNAPAARRQAPDAYARLPAEQPRQDFSQPRQDYGARQPTDYARQQPTNHARQQPTDYTRQQEHTRQPYQQPPQLPPRDQYQEKFSARMYNIDPCPSDPLALSNRLVINEQDFANAEFVILRNQYIFSIMYVSIPITCTDMQPRPYPHTTSRTRRPVENDSPMGRTLCAR